MKSWMKNRRLWLVLTVTLVALVVCMTCSVVLAQSAGKVSKQEAVLNKVVQIYQKNTGTTIDSTQLKLAFTEALKELKAEKWLNNLASKGKLTQAEADEYLKWLQSKPNIQIKKGQ